MEEETKDKMLSIEYHIVLKYYEDVFGEIPRLPVKRYIGFYIDLVHGASLLSKNPCRMSKTELKELQMQLKEILNKG